MLSLISEYTVINIIESVLFSVLCGLFIKPKKGQHIVFIMVLSVTIFIYITISNYFVIYDSLYSIIECAIMVIIMSVFQANDTRIPIENIIIFTLIFSISISIFQEVDILIIYSLFKVLPLTISTSNWIMPAFVISRLLLSIFIYCLCKYTKKYNHSQTIYAKQFVVIFLILYSITTMLESKLYLDNPDIYFVCLLNILLFIITIFLYLSFCHSTYTNQQTQTQTALTLELKAINDSALAYKEKEKELRIIKHDLSNQLSIIHKYLEINDINSGLRIIENNLDKLKKIPVVINTGYTAIDAILSNKLSIANEKKIETFYSIQIDHLNHNEEIDIALILANLLDNAIENISDCNKYINIKIHSTQQLIIRVKNTTDNQSNSLNTSKTDKANHGLGLESVRRIAEFYNGELITKHENGVFIALVLLYRKES